MEKIEIIHLNQKAIQDKIRGCYHEINNMLNQIFLEKEIKNE